MKTETQHIAILEALAYLIDRKPELSPAEIRNLILETVDEIRGN